MKDAGLFQLGYGLETGAQEEDKRGSVPANDHARDVLDENRHDHFIREGDSIYAGNHVIIEVVNGHGLDDETRIQNAFRKIIEVCGATLLHIHTHKFSPQGVSGVAVLAESHISVHTWPEIGYGAFDVFMCGDAKPWLAIDVLKEAFGTQDVRTKSLKRGEGLITDEVAA
ncbi:adenosylmethionine decarboxylase [uncultured Pelagimonas sp.]|uniref:adenosylmethionine decarboxylase n=1 Tax=uncultured Pelagimonas sp. TaxID=1618102 RepID=UPI002630A4E9|nr:adenosylmethionine decarboxylase [uncultured Pelagimonas sp.]